VSSDRSGTTISEDNDETLDNGMNKKNRKDNDAGNVIETHEHEGDFKEW
jgi:hypothetical protein